MGDIAEELMRTPHSRTADARPRKQERLFQVTLMVPAGYEVEALDKVTVTNDAPIVANVVEHGSRKTPARFVFHKPHGEKEARWVSEQGDELYEVDLRRRLDLRGSEAEALEVVRRINRMVAGPYGGTVAHSKLWVVTDGPDPGTWAVIDVETAIEMNVPYKWVA